MKLTPYRVSVRVVVLTLVCALFTGAVYSQNSQVCPIGVGTEPGPAAASAYAYQVKEVYFPYFTKWQNLSNLRLSDDKKATITLSDINRSRQIMGNNLRFQIPQGAIIRGITLTVEGQSDRYQDIDEAEIYLLGPTGETKGHNKNNKARLQKAWKSKADGSDHIWTYGSSSDTWGTQWTPEDINSPDFGYQIQIRTIDTAAVNVQVDQVTVSVDYTPAYSFCMDNCLVFYVDKYEQYGSYVWHYPEEFSMVSSSVLNQTIDLKAGNAAYGLYEICVDVYHYGGTMAGTCCRQFLYQNCNSSEIKGMAWLDLNDNRLRDPGEGILSNAQLVLYDTLHQAVDTLLTDPFGNYHFKDIPVGKYYIKASPVPNMKMVAFNNADPDYNSDITHANGQGTTDFIQTQIGTCVSGIDFGFSPLSNLGDLVWNDKNLNGLQDAGEQGIPQVKVRLMRADGSPYDSTMTNASGNYMFADVPANKYFLQFVTPQDFQPTFTLGNSPDTNSDINPQGRTGLYTFTSPTTKKDIDAGYYQTARIGDQAWIDKNGNGVFNVGELSLQGVVVRLYGTAGDGTATDRQTTTGSDGKYFFNDVKPGVYNLAFTPPAGYFLTVPNQGGDDKDSDPVSGVAGPVTIAGGQLVFDIDAGLYQPASISNFVWEDLNGNGIQDPGEAGLSDVKVTLTEFLRDQTIDHGFRITDANGYYIFDNLKPGTFKLTFEGREGFVFTVPNAGTDDTRDSDPVNGMVNDIMLMSGEQNDTYDAGMLRNGTLGNYVWEDINANGLQDNGEPGLGGVVVRLTGVTTTGLTVAEEVTTDASGRYEFTNLKPGNYTITLILPQGYQHSASERGTDDALDSDGLNGVVAAINITSGVQISNIDFGLFRRVSIGDFVWDDLNANGLQDAGEPGLAGVVMTLTGTSGSGSIVMTDVVTDGSGAYGFIGLEPGNYKVTVALPSGYSLTVANAGASDDTDSDFSGTISQSLGLISGQTVSNLDAGLYKSVSLGDRVWHDLNANGLQEAGEPGMADVTVTLTGTSGSGVAVQTTTLSGADGRYTFDNLEPGVYTITFALPGGFEFTVRDAGNDENLDSDTDDGIISGIIVISGQSRDNLDAGMFSRGTLGDFVWLDANGNGLQDASEQGLGQVLVTLTGSDGSGNAVMASVTTDGQGNYLFENLKPGMYMVSFVATAAYTPTIANAGNNDDLDSDFNGTAVPVVMISGSQIRNMDAGFFAGSTVGDYVWEDLNANGIQDAGEPGLQGVPIVLTGTLADGSMVMASTVSGGGGRYQFTQLAPGTYNITFNPGSAYISTIKNAGFNPAGDSDAEAGSINGIVLTSGISNPDLDAGFYRSGSVAGLIWEDKDGNAIRQQGEPTLAGITMTLTGTTGSGQQLTRTVQTMSDGSYIFSGLVPGTYSVSAALQSVTYWVTPFAGNDSAVDSDLDASGKSSDFVLESNTNITSVDGGLVRYSSLGDFVWLDTNGNGVQDVAEPGTSGITLILSGTDATGNNVSITTVTDTNGKYLFSNLKPGTYTLTVEKPTVYQYSASNAGSDDDLDSDGVNGTISGIMVMSGTVRSDLDFGFVAGIGIGDFVWDDLNVNGIQDAGEPGIPGVSLLLTGTANDGTTINQTTITGADGRYLFAGVYPGSYTITVELPAGYSPTKAMAGTDPALDSNLSENSNSWSFVVTGTSSDLNLDFGMVRLGSIGDIVWEDMNCNGILDAGEPGLPGVQVRLTGIDLFAAVIDRTAVTGPDGYYLFNGLRPGSYMLDFILPSGYELSSATVNVADLKSGDNLLNLDAPAFRRASLGDFVWNDLNMNGLQDAGEPGIGGIRVTLTNLTQTDIPAIVLVTDQNGFYKAEGLKPGTYSVDFQVRNDLEATAKNAGNDALDSDIDTSGKADSVTLRSGDVNNDTDAGFISTATSSIGDYVWEDLNANGIQEGNEPGVPFVQVRLTGTTSGGSTINLTTQTDFGGLYIFDGLQAGMYEITFIPSFIYKITKQNIGQEDLDSDADPLSGATGMFLLGTGENLLNLDAGVYSVSAIGDQVWDDQNRNGLKDVGEPGIPNVQLTLLDEQGNTVSTATSADFGFYLFSDLTPGKYRVRADIPPGYVLTEPFGPDPENNSDFSVINNEVTTELISLTSNTFRLDIDLGLRSAIGSVSGYAWFDADGDGLRETSEAILDSVRVVLISAVGDTLAVDTTDLSGMYLFEGLQPGNYRIGFEIFGDSTFTVPGIGLDPNIDSDVTDLALGTTAIFTLQGGEDITGVNAGYATYAMIGDFAWLDANENGLQDTGEAGINNIKVYLLDDADNVLDSTITAPFGGASGYYSFMRIHFGNYKVRFELKENFRFTNHVSDMPLINSDIADQMSDTTFLFFVTPGQNRKDIDAGYALIAPVTGSLEGLVWQDNNNSKFREAGDQVLSGVAVSLFTAAGTLVSTKVSAADGTYRFDDLPFGDYYLSVPAMSDKLFVLYQGTPHPADSDITNGFGPGTTRILTVFPGDTLRQTDMGYAPKISIGDFVWHDLNNNGLQDAGEPGLPGVKVRLVNEVGVVEQTVTTALDGRYLFQNVAVGRYILEFEKLTDYVFAINNNSDPTRNSDPNQNTGRTALLDFTVQQSYTNIDAGYVRGGKVGDMLWLDLNGNGVYQIGEPGIPNIKVRLFTSSGMQVDSVLTTSQPGMNDFVGFYRFSPVRPGNYYIKFDIPQGYLIPEPHLFTDDIDNDITGANGPFTTDVFSVASNQTIDTIDGAAYLPATLGDFVWNDVNKNGIQEAGEPGVPGVTVNLFTQSGQLLDTKVTNNQGRYQFTGLRQRLYYLQFSLPDGFEFTLQNASGNNATDSDVDATGTTPLISLAHGSTLLDIDAGIHILSGRIVMGNIWNDINEDGRRVYDEPLMADVKVYLKSMSNEIVDQFTTNHAGMYCLKALNQGDYTVFVESPDNHVFSSKNAIPDPNMDCDFNPDGSSDILNMGVGYTMKYADAGLYFKLITSLNGLVWKDVNKNGIRDTGDTPMPNVVIFLFNKFNTFVKSTKSDENGNYSLKSLDPGQYYCRLPEYPDLTYVMFTGSNTDKDSEFTHQYGVATSRLITLSGGTPESHFDFGYRSINGVVESPNDRQIEDVSVYPNPTISHIRVRLPQGQEGGKYFILNSMGQVVMEGRMMSNDDDIDVFALPAGRYALHVNNGNNNWRKSFAKFENR